MEFATLELKHMEELRPYFRKNPCRLSDYTAGGTFMWRDYLRTQFAVIDGILYLKVIYPPGIEAFALPRRADTDAPGESQAWFHDAPRAYERIIEHCRSTGVTPRICAVSERTRPRILEAFPESNVSSVRDWSDYIYNSSDLRDLPGRKYSGQRNHINRFVREHPDWSIEPLTADNLCDFRRFFESYAREHTKDYAAYDEGNRKTLEVLDNLGAYGMFGAALYADGKIIGASLGEKMGDTLYVHIEKADTRYHGAYPMLVTQFSKLFATDEVLFINREEDDGVEGLRASKLSYHPCELAEKFLIELR